MVGGIYIGIAYATLRFTSTRQILARLSGVYAFSLFIGLAFLLAMIAALGGAGVAVYRRLHGR